MDRLKVGRATYTSIRGCLIYGCTDCSHSEREKHFLSLLDEKDVPDLDEHFAMRMNPDHIPELAEDLECYWCMGTHAEGEVCPYAPYYVEGSNDH